MEISPQGPEASYGIEQQNALIDRGRFGEAERSLRLWLGNHAQNESGVNVRRLELGRLLLWEGKPSEAKAELESLRDSEGIKSWVASMLGQTEATLGNYDRARELFEEALRLDPGNHEALLFIDPHVDVVDQTRKLRRFLTHGRMTGRGYIEALTLTKAIDFRRGRKLNFETGEITQEAHDRYNLQLDAVQVGQEVNSEVTLRRQFDESEEIVFYTSQAFGDAILGLSTIQAFAAYFERHPERKKPVQIVTPFTNIFAGLTEKYPFVTVKKVGEIRDPREGELYANDLRSRGRKTFAITNSGSEAYESLQKARNKNTTAVVNAFVDRFSRDIFPWGRPKPHTYSQKLFRFMEAMLGEKLIASPANVVTDLPPSSAVIRAGEALVKQYGLNKSNFHCVVEAASKVSKKLSDQQFIDILTEMASQNRQEAGVFGTPAKIVFIQDIGAQDSFAPRVTSLPKNVRDNVVVIKDSLENVAGLITQARSVIGPDTGISHMAAAMGKPIVIVTTVADPALWNTGGKNVTMLASPEAYEAQRNLTPVNMIEWETDAPIAARSFTSGGIIDAWKKINRR